LLPVALARTRGKRWELDMQAPGCRSWPPALAIVAVGLAVVVH
jgi:hypothetical protein